MPSDHQFVRLIAFDTVTCGIRQNNSGICWGSLHRNFAKCSSRYWPFSDASVAIIQIASNSIAAFSNYDIQTITGSYRFTGTQVRVNGIHTPLHQHNVSGTPFTLSTGAAPPVCVCTISLDRRGLSHGPQPQPGMFSLRVHSRPATPRLDYTSDTQSHRYMRH